MRILAITAALLLTGCAGTGAGGFTNMLEQLTIDTAPGDGMTESGCFFGEYVGTWTKFRITYTKIIHPEGTAPPNC